MFNWIVCFSKMQQGRKYVTLIENTKDVNSHKYELQISLFQHQLIESKSIHPSISIVLQATVIIK